MLDQTREAVEAAGPGPVALIGSSLGAFVAVERRIQWPLVDLSLLRNPRFSVLVVAGPVSNVAYGVTIYLSTLSGRPARIN